MTQEEALRRLRDACREKIGALVDEVEDDALYGIFAIVTYEQPDYEPEDVAPFVDWPLLARRDEPALDYFARVDLIRKQREAA